DFAVLDADALSQRESETIHRAALGLRRDVVGLHRRAAVDRAPDFVHLDLTAGAIDRHFEDARNLRTRIVEIGKAKPAALALAAPVRHCGDALDHFDRAR